MVRDRPIATGEVEVVGTKERHAEAKDEAEELRGNPGSESQVAEVTGSTHHHEGPAHWS